MLREHYTQLLKIERSDPCFKVYFYRCTLRLPSAYMGPIRANMILARHPKVGHFYTAILYTHQLFNIQWKFARISYSVFFVTNPETQLRRVLIVRVIKCSAWRKIKPKGIETKFSGTSDFSLISWLRKLRWSTWCIHRFNLALYVELRRTICRASNK